MDVIGPDGGFCVQAHGGGIAHPAPQRRAGFVAHEQGPAQLFFEQVDTGAYRGLADIQPLGRANEIAAADDFKKCPDDLSVHNSYLAKILVQTPEIFRLSELTRLTNVERSKMMHREMLRPVGEPTTARG